MLPGLGTTTVEVQLHCFQSTDFALEPKTRYCGEQGMCTQVRGYCVGEHKDQPFCFSMKVSLFRAA